MRITKYTDYPLRVLFYLSALEEDHLATVSEIATAYNISKNHIVKAVHNLAKLGYVFTLRGRSGGIRLLIKPTEIVIGQFVREVEISLVPVNCSQPKCQLQGDCFLFEVLNSAVEAYLNALDNYTLADILSNKATARQLKKLVTLSQYS